MLDLVPVFPARIVRIKRQHKSAALFTPNEGKGNLGQSCILEDSGSADVADAAVCNEEAGNAAAG